MQWYSKVQVTSLVLWLANCTLTCNVKNTPFSIFTTHSNRPLNGSIQSMLFTKKNRSFRPPPPISYFPVRLEKCEFLYCTPLSKRFHCCLKYLTKVIEKDAEKYITKCFELVCAWLLWQVTGLCIVDGTIEDIWGLAYHNKKSSSFSRLVSISLLWIYC